MQLRITRSRCRYHGQLLIDAAAGQVETGTRLPGNPMIRLSGICEGNAKCAAGANPFWLRMWCNSGLKRAVPRICWRDGRDGIATIKWDLPPAAHSYKNLFHTGQTRVIDVSRLT
jgi:hypothetical protein